MKNPYIPEEVEVKEVRTETQDIKTLKLLPKANSPLLNYLPGQFMMLSVFGVGECPISIASSPSRPPYLEFSVKKVGSVSSALHELEAGDKLYVRGPYGNGFPLDKLRGKRLIIVGGGVGLPPLRSLINYALDHRKSYGKLSILYGAKTPKDMVFRKELELWSGERDVEVLLTVDVGDEEWEGEVGVVPQLLEKITFTPSDTYALVCGPEIMMRYTAIALKKKGLAGENILISMERKMHCGIGKCGHCNVGSFYVCTHGPVFTLKQLEKTREFRL